jgi:hypothetical protein
VVARLILTTLYTAAETRVMLKANYEIPQSLLGKLANHDTRMGDCDDQYFPAHTARALPTTCPLGTVIASGSRS